MNAATSLIAAILLLSLAFVVRISAQSPSIYGAYQVCPFHCWTIKINRDSTFEYRLNGDLFNDERYKGTWRFIGKNKIKANSPEDHSSPDVTEKATGRDSDFLVTVFDASGTVLGAVLSGSTNGVAFKVETGRDGVAHIPKCQRFEIASDRYRGTHEVVNPQADEFTISITVEQSQFWVVDETWLIEGNRLYVAAQDGSFRKDHWLSKLSPSKTRQIFKGTRPSIVLDLTNASDDELQQHLGERITMHGRFSLRGKLGPFIVATRPVYLLAKGSFSWGRAYARMEARDVRVTGTLRFAHYPEPSRGALAEGRPTDHFYFEAETSRIELNKR
jgi:hypothetical protein